MTIRRQWQQFLDSAMDSFLDYHYPDDWPEEQWDDTLKELIAEVEGSIEDKWHDLCKLTESQLRTQDFADAGHPDTEEAMAEAEAHHDLAANR